jgi:hypothetical protein
VHLGKHEPRRRNSGGPGVDSEVVRESDRRTKIRDSKFKTFKIQNKIQDSRFNG